MKVYFKRADTGKLGMLVAGGYESPQDAALAVKESLVANQEPYNEPVLVLIQGGKNAVDH